MFLVAQAKNLQGTLELSLSLISKYYWTYLQNVSRICPLLINSTLSSLSLVFPTFTLVLLESICILYTLHCADKMC